MKKDIEDKKIGMQQILTIFWILLTSLILVLMMFYYWHIYHQNKLNRAEKIGHNQVFQFDEFIENLLETTFSLNFSEQQFSNCDKELLPKLKEVLFNHPHISGITISDINTNTICSTLDNQQNIYNPKTKIYLTGPLDLGGKYNDVYLLQHRVGHYYFTIYLLKNLLSSYLSSANSSGVFQTIALYNTKDKSIILSSKNEILIEGKMYGNSNLNELQNKMKFILVPSQTLDNYLFILVPTTHSYELEFVITELIIVVIILWLTFYFFQLASKLVEKHYSLNKMLQIAMKKDQFIPYYQPIVDVVKNQFCGAEVLLRWNDENDNIIEPDGFIPVAEQTGVIIPITLQLVEKSLADCHLFLNNNPVHHLSYNLSAVHFKNAEFFPKMFNLFDRYKINPKQIILELTERQLFDISDTQSIERIKELRNKGFSLAIDDFGTGHASFPYLEKIPFNYLKIDKIFIQAIGTGAVTETLNQVIINLANSLNLSIVAEGVETAEQYSYLRKNNVDFVQGWYFAKAMNFVQYSAFLQENSECIFRP